MSSTEEKTAEKTTPPTPQLATPKKSLFYLDDDFEFILSTQYPQFCLTCGVTAADNKLIRAHADECAHYTCNSCMLQCKSVYEYRQHNQRKHHTDDPSVATEQVKFCQTSVQRIAQAVKDAGGAGSDSGLGTLYLLHTMMLHFFGLAVWEREDVQKMMVSYMLVQGQWLGVVAEEVLAPHQPGSTATPTHTQAEDQQYVMLLANPYTQLLDRSCPGRPFLIQILECCKTVFFAHYVSYKLGEIGTQLSGAALKMFLDSNYFAACHAYDVAANSGDGDGGNDGDEKKKPTPDDSNADGDDDAAVDSDTSRTSAAAKVAHVTRIADEASVDLGERDGWTSSVVRRTHALGVKVTPADTDAATATPSTTAGAMADSTAIDAATTTKPATDTTSSLSSVATSTTTMPSLDDMLQAAKRKVAAEKAQTAADTAASVEKVVSKAKVSAATLSDKNKKKAAAAAFRAAIATSDDDPSTSSKTAAADTSLPRQTTAAERAAFRQEVLSPSVTADSMTSLDALSSSSSSSSAAAAKATPNVRLAGSSAALPFESGQPCIGCDSAVGSKRCAGCKLVYYCSRQCQKQHWLAHKQICNAMKRLEQRAVAGLAAKADERKTSDADDAAAGAGNPFDDIGCVTVKTPASSTATSSSSDAKK